MSKLIGMDVVGASGRKLGDIEDVIVDTNSGRVHYAILSFGGFFGLGDKLFAMPLSQLRRDARGRLLLDIDREQLKSAPAFEGKRWPDWSVDTYRADVDRRYGSAPAGANARLRRASDLLKANVRDANRADIGDIKDLVVDLRNSRVHHVVVEFDRSWNPNDKLVALPMSALRDGTSMPTRRDEGAGAPTPHPSKFLSLEAPSGPTKGTASATDPPGGVLTRPAAAEAGQNVPVQQLDRQTLPTTTSYADDEDLVFDGTRERLTNAPAFDKKRYPDLTDPARRKELDRGLSNW